MGTLLTANAGFVARRDNRAYKDIGIDISVHGGLAALQANIDFTTYTGDLSQRLTHATHTVLAGHPVYFEPYHPDPPSIASAIYTISPHPI